MDWAIDRLGHIVRAQAARQVLAYGFTCPTCGEPVRLRAGLERRAHFAHYSYSAKPECENYHPSVFAGQIAPIVQPKDLAFAPRQATLRGGIFLDRGESGRFAFYLKLPRLKADSAVAGELRIQSGLGARTFAALQLLKSQFLRVNPQLPLVTASGTNDMAEVAAVVQQDVSMFRSTANFFRAGGDSGRLLASLEPLEWGEAYRIVTQQPFSRIPIGLECELAVQPGLRGGWYIYEVSLPFEPREGDISAERLEEFFGRAIRVCTSRAFIVDPLPHHIEPDGTHIYSNPPPHLLLRKTGGDEVEVDGSARVSTTVISDAYGGWVAIDGISAGELSVSINGQRQVSLRTDDCRLFCPAGVQLIVGEKVLEVFDADVPQTMSSAAASVVVETHSRRVADFVRADASWSRRGNQYVADKGASFPEIDAGNFGSIARRGGLELARVTETTTNRELIARRAWIAGILLRVGGPRALMQVKQLWRQPPSGGLEAALGRHAWLKPYIERTLREVGGSDDVLRG